MALVSVRAVDRTISWLGVGNVLGVLLRMSSVGTPKNEGIVQRGGVVGLSLPPLRVSVIPVSLGDTLILATDGIRPGFAKSLTPVAPIQQSADRILARFGLKSDDALVLVARIAGGAL